LATKFRRFSRFAALGAPENGTWHPSSDVTLTRRGHGSAALAPRAGVDLTR
jgi:hypothetical protein